MEQQKKKGSQVELEKAFKWSIIIIIQHLRT